ncbi:hypothetical protein [Aestuariibaculum marinum]|uniref:Uncharacterized protein n=1 Tax=Aestuariibaculum marinum TaxID=2683592 RepID=A0A8J6U469_9FLAO|nr:hypothetical protein [Aestuariibaculum marinum]MBD0822644.1 hypothetical protein [Aestuariibaculum marinum]
MRKHFETVYKRLIEANLSENTLCKEFWMKIKKLHANFNEEDCWSLLVENIEWCINTGTMTTEDLIKWFTPDQLNAHGIYISGNIKINSGFAIGIGDVCIEAVGHSKVILFDTAICKAFDTSFVKGFHESSMEINNCVGEAFNFCNVIAKDFSKIEAWDDATVEAQTYTCVMAHDRAQVENSYHSHTLVV